MKFILVLLALTTLAMKAVVAEEVNLALKKPTKMSISYFAHNASLAVDGKLNTETWIPPNRYGVSWWQVDLGGTYYISDITVVNTKRTNSAQDITGIFTILSLDNKITYDVSSIWSFSNETIAAGNSVIMKKALTSSAPDAARYITVWKYKDPKRFWLTLVEVIVHGTKEAPILFAKYNCANKNPCTAANIDANNFYFAHEIDGFYVQCSQYGSCYKMPCAGGLIWNVEKNACTVGGL